MWKIIHRTGYLSTEKIIHAGNKPQNEIGAYTDPQRIIHMENKLENRDF